MPPTKTVITNGTVRSPKLTVDFINVGQGNAVLVSYPNGEFMLADCGSQETSTSGKRYKHAEQYINTVTGGKDIQTVVMSHGDDDHTVFVPDITCAQNPTYVHYGGKIGDYSNELQKWIKKWENKPGKFVFRYPESYSDQNPDADFGSETEPGEAHVRVLGANYGDDPNLRSIVLLVRFGKQGVLLPGDAEVATEAFIMSKVPAKMLNRATVLMPGHHGALESTSKPWAEAIDPNIAAISASGTNMSYAHPSCATNKLLLKYLVDHAEQHSIICSDGKGIAYKKSQTTGALLVTATNGDIRYQTDGTNYKVMVSSFTQFVPQVVVRGPDWDALVRNGPWSGNVHPGYRPIPAEINVRPVRVPRRRVTPRRRLPASLAHRSM